MFSNVKNPLLWKYGAGKMWSLGLGMALLLVVFTAGCGGTAKPTLTSIAPSSGAQGAVVAVTLTGTDFGTGSTISLSGTGITVSNTMVVSKTSITATFTIAANAATGAQNVTVTSAGKVSGSQAFTVTSGAPTLSGVSPSSGALGQAEVVTLTGTLFAAGATIGLSGTGITVSNIMVVSSTSITATFTIAANAPTGAQNVTVTTAVGTSGTQTFTVNLLPPTVTSTNPANGATAVPLNRKITAAFSKAMDATTITTATFTVVGGTNVAGAVTFDTGSNIATFAPAANLAANTTFTATITTGAKDLTGDSLASNFVWTFKTGAAVDATAPTLISTNPASAITGVALNQKITATFSKVMDSATITTTTFTLMQGANAVTGTVSYAGTTATFTPSAALTASLVYTATITAGAKDLAGNALAGGGAAPNPWMFTTGTLSNNSAPTVTLTVPADLAMNVGINQTINATFSTGMDPTTINTGTFTVAGPGATSFLTGTVTYNATSNVATFAPTANLASNVLYTATVTTGAKDLAGNALAANKIWTFTTGTTMVGQAPVNLRSLSTFVAVAGGGLTNSNSGGQTTLNGDVGLSPTGTCLGDGSPCSALDPKINGTLYANDPAGIAAQAKADLLLAYTDATGRPPGTVEADLSGMVLPPGVYTSGSTMSIAVNGVLTLDAQGDANAVWIFQIGSALTINNSAKVLLINGAKAANVFWAVGSSSTLGTNVSFKGNILAQSSNSLGNLSVVEGRMLCSTGQITLLSNTVTVPAP